MRTARLLLVLSLAGALGACAAPRQAGTAPRPTETAEPDRQPQRADAPAPARAERAERAERADAPGALQRAVAALRGSGTLDVAAGTYVLEASPYTDPSCGNCENPDEQVPATLGLRLTGRDVTLRGVHRDSVVIDTRAGYGILVEDCENCRISGLTITGGTRDDDGRATSAAVVVRRSTVIIEDCIIRDNIGDSATVARTVVGVIGIAGREGADITVRNCEIRRNSWDGIALYRGARAHIADNVIDGVDKASGARIGGGRGVGIGLTWDAHATIERNRVTRYWKGIGTFVNAQADIRENVVEDVLTWGIALWAPANGRATARIGGNIVYRTGACGVMIDRASTEGAPGALVGNVVARTGQNERYDSGEPYCWQRPIARHNVPAGFDERANLLFDNRQPRPAGSAPAPLPELLEAGLVQRARPLATSLAAHPALRNALVFRELPALVR